MTVKIKIATTKEEKERRYKKLNADQEKQRGLINRAKLENTKRPRGRI